MEMKFTARRKPVEKTRPSIYLMAESKQKQAPKGGGDSSSESSAGGQKLAKKGEKLKEDMDALGKLLPKMLPHNRLTSSAASR